MKICVPAMLSLSLLLSGVAASWATEAEDNLKAFPAAEKGMTRHVLFLPPQADESLFQVELVVGKTVKNDKVNRFFFGGQIEAKNIDGWGFTKYVVPSLGPMAGTLIGVDPNEPQVERFITLGGEPFIVRYNSRLPLVVYVPEGTEVRHRLWKTTAETVAIPAK
ncbi:MAG: proteinase inhibitor I4 serpin [Planctomyces sp.]|nr:proteinase inhibitor I4 serpin [Planctomyces sp.]